MAIYPSTSCAGRPRRGRSFQHALTVGPDITSRPPRTGATDEPGLVVLAEDLMGKRFGGKKAPEHEVIARISGAELCGARYEQLLDWAEPMEGVSVVRIIPGDFVTTEDGTGIVHTAPTFEQTMRALLQLRALPPCSSTMARAKGSRWWTRRPHPRRRWAFCRSVRQGGVLR